MRSPDICTRDAPAVNIGAMDESFKAPERFPRRLADHSRVRAETLGQLGAQFAHDFNNVLAVVLTSVEMAMRVGDPAKANIFLANALKVISRGRLLTDRLAAASYACESLSAIDVKRLISRLCAEADAQKPAGASVVSQFDATRYVVNVDAGFFEEAVRNLIANGREAIADGGTLTVSARNAHGAELRGESGRDYLVIAVADSGAGMPDGVRNQAFDLFFSARAEDGRRGLGLAQAKDAVRRAGGLASIESKAGQGTTVTLAIPLATE